MAKSNGRMSANQLRFHADNLEQGKRGTVVRAIKQLRGWADQINAREAQEDHRPLRERAAEISKALKEKRTRDFVDYMERLAHS